MNFKIDVSDRFKKQLKILVKKYPSLKSEYSDLIESLEHNPVQGTPVGHSCYKIRLSITSKGKGKSGGARVITHVYITGKTVYLLSIYDKSEQENISDKELASLLLEVIG